MTRDFLKNLGLENDVIDKILDENMANIGEEKKKTMTAETSAKELKEKLKTAETDLETLRKSSGDVTAVQKQLTELQTKYDTDTADLKGQLSARDYADAISKAMSDYMAKNGLSKLFTSKSAENSFVSDLKANQRELKDGTIADFDKIIDEWKANDPDAFAPDKPAPRFATGSGAAGGHGTPAKPMSRAAELSAKYQENLYGTKKE